MRIVTIFVTVLLSTAASAQTIPSLASLTTGVDAQGRSWGRARIQAPMGDGLTVVRRYFSAQESQGPASQVRVVRKVYRDSAGRTRVERLVPEGADPPNRPLLIELNDPAAGVMYILDVERKTAHRVRYSPSSRLTMQPIIGPGRAPAVNGVVPRVTEEALGSRVIEGIPADGQRFTTAIPPDATRTEEIWTSPGLWLTIRRNIGDPRDGDTVYELTNIHLDEPDPALFQPPVGYRVVNAAAAFDLEFGAAPVETAPGPDGVYRVGNGVSPPTRISGRQPEGTKDAGRVGISGIVITELVVGADGVPRDIRVVQSLDPGLDRNTVEAISDWRFRPAQLNGRPVPVRATVQTSFKVGIGPPPGPLPRLVSPPPGDSRAKDFPKTSRPE